MTVGISVEVDVLDGRPVVVKTAVDPNTADRLRRERERIEAVGHPGVVEVVASSEEPTVSLTLAWAGDRSLETFRPELDVAVAVLVSIATTIADLHQMGLVHGRLEPAHVTVDAEGHPRLCGMAGVDPEDLPPTPADDVAAIGALILVLVGIGSEGEPIPERRWTRRRWTGFQQRALQTLADHATDPDPGRRPSARSLARSLAEVMPRARLRPSERTPVREVRTGPTIVDEHASAPDLDWDAWLADDDPNPADLPLVERTADHAGLSAPTADPGSPPDRRRVAAASVALMIAIVAAAILLRGAPDGGRTQLATSSPVTTEGTDRATTTSAVPSTSAVRAATSAPGTRPSRADCPPVAAPSADVDGDGCREALHIHGAAIQAGSARFQAGEPHDQVAVGDWDCDGIATPAVIRPSTGEVFVFARWASSNRPITMGPTAVIPDATRPATTVAPSCGPLVVQRADGSSTSVDLDRGGS